MHQHCLSEFILTNSFTKYTTSTFKVGINMTLLRLNGKIASAKLKKEEIINPCSFESLTNLKGT